MPLEWNQDGSPRDPALWQMFDTFSRQEYNRPAEIQAAVKQWVAVETRPEGGYMRVWGHLIVRQAVTVPTFHISRPDGKEQVSQVHQSRDGLYDRAKGFIADWAGSGVVAYVYIAPEAKEAWQSYLNEIGAKDASLVAVEV